MPTVEIQADGQITHHGICPFCRKPSKVSNLESEAYSRWRAGEYVYACFPSLSQESARTLLNGVHTECWEEMFR